MTTESIRTDEAHALALDAADPLAPWRREFAIPTHHDGTDVAYFCGNSLGLMPLRARDAVAQELDDWARLAVDAHLSGAHPWYSYHDNFRETGARIVGARPGEVVMMNGLTTNLHLMLVSFYQPEGERRRILMEAPAFPSDTYAVQTHMRSRGADPDTDLIVVGPRSGESTVRTADLIDAIREHGDTLATILIGGVNFLTGQFFDLEAITTAGHEVGATVGFDLAHAAGNVPLQLHDWNVDFACWCSYKYLNGSPGAISGCFVHERNSADVKRTRFGGWWGNDPDTRFQMQLIPEFHAVPRADGWQLSNPPILAMAPLRVSLEIFDEVGMSALRAKSLQLTPYLRTLLEAQPHDWYEVVTPREPDAHGCQLSIVVKDRPKERFAALQAHGVVADFREPDVIRIAPTPLYNSFHDAWRFVQAISSIDDEASA